jgi:hypothetical protein
MNKGMSQARKAEETEDRKYCRNKLKDLGHPESKTNSLIKTLFLIGGLSCVNNRAYLSEK